MKPQILDRETSQDFFIKQTVMGSILSLLSAVESWNKIQKQVLKDTLLKDLSPSKIKQLSVIFILNHINSLLIMQKICMIYEFISSQTFRDIMSIISCMC